jgi:hypothetical protein
LGGDPRPNEFMAIAFTIISVLGMLVFFRAGDWPVGLVFVGLTCVYVSELFAGLFARRPETKERLKKVNVLGERAVGFFRLATGGWLMYLTFALTLNAASGFHLPA